CPICKQSGVPGQMVFTQQEGFDVNAQQAIWGIYDHDMQFPNQHTVRHVHRTMQQQQQQQEQDPRIWEKATEREEIKRWRFEVKEIGDKNTELLRATIRVLDYKLSKVITAL